MFLGGTDGDPYVAGAVRRGAVFAAIAEGDDPCEVVLLPFRFNASRRAPCMGSCRPSVGR